MAKEKQEPKRKKKWGDRRGARLMKEIDPVHTYMAHLMPKRCEAEVFIRETVDITNLLEFMKRRNEEGKGPKTTLFHCICTAVAKTISMRPILNRFVSGRRYFMRDQISMAFVAKRQFEDYAEETLVTIFLEDDTDLSIMSQRISGDVQKVRKTDGNKADDILRILQKMPRFVMAFLMWIFRRLDYHGKLPAWFTDNDPNYATVLLSNLGSIKCGAPYHHLSNFGTTSIIVTIGQIHKAEVIDEEGVARVRDVVELGLTLDERIGDGFYFARSVRLLKYILAHPELLDRPITESFDYEY